MNDDEYEPTDDEIAQVASLMCREAERGRTACYSCRDGARRFMVRLGGFPVLP